MKQFDLSPTNRPSVALVLLSELIRPGRPEFAALPAFRQLWRRYHPIILTRPTPPPELDTRPHHLTVGSIGAGRLIKPVEELIAWAIQKGRLVQNPLLRKTFARTALLDRAVHFIFPAKPEQLVLTTLLALANMATAHGIDRASLVPMTAAAENLAQALINRFRNLSRGSLAAIGPHDTIVFLNFAPYSNEDWLNRFLSSRPDLVSTNVILLAGEPPSTQLVTAFPSIAYDGTLAEVLIGQEMSQQRYFPSHQLPHIPYYFDGLRSLTLGVDNQAFSGADELRSLLEDILRTLPKFTVISLDRTITPLNIADQLIGKFIFNYARLGGSALIVSGVDGVSPVLTGAIVDPAFEKNLVSSAFHDHYGLASVGSPHGNISDVAPTVLKLLGLPIPYQMTGRSLV